jgi:hypothetical protein
MNVGLGGLGSRENLFVGLLMMPGPSHELEPPKDPARFAFRDISAVHVDSNETCINGVPTNYRRFGND